MKTTKSSQIDPSGQDKHHWNKIHQWRFNKNFTQIRLNLAKDIGTSTKSLTECINKHGNTQPEKVIPVNEFEDAFMQ